MFEALVSLVVAIARVNPPSSISLLGTGFVVANSGVIATTLHSLNNSDTNLVVLPPDFTDLNTYQDTTSLPRVYSKVIIQSADPLRDIALLKTDGSEISGKLPSLGSFDDIDVGGDLAIFGYPHAVEGRRVLTIHRSHLGAKILLPCQNILTKHGIINTQARPGQSGSPIVSIKEHRIVGMLIGAYAATMGSGVSISGLNPSELHQTTHCISAEYISAML